MCVKSAGETSIFLLNSKNIAQYHYIKRIKYSKSLPGINITLIMNQHIKLIIKIIITVVLIIYVAMQIDLQDIKTRLINVDGQYLVYALIASFATGLFHALRWNRIIATDDKPLSLKDAVNLVFIGYFFSQMLPSSIGGDAMRVWRSHKMGLAMNHAIISVLVDRFLSLLGVVALILIFSVYFYNNINNATVLNLLILFCISSIIISILLVFADRFPQRFLPAKIGGFIQKLARCIRHIFRPAVFLYLLALSAIVHILVSFIVYLSAEAFHIPLSIPDAILLIPPVIMITTIPVSIGGWGIRETAMIFFLGLASVSSSDALLLSVTLGLIFIVTSIPGGIIWALTGNAAERSAAEQINMSKI